MYSKEENQRLKRDFWVLFANKYPRKWLLYNTKVKDFSFKFYVEKRFKRDSVVAPLLVCIKFFTYKKITR
jgi:hypothetical protein